MVRRCALAALASSLGVAVAGDRPRGAGDAALLQLCAAVGRLHGETVTHHDVLDDMRHDDPAYDGMWAGLTAMVDRLQELRHQVAQLPATTHAGLVAKARVVEAHWFEPDSPDEEVAWSLVCDLLGRPA